MKPDAITKLLIGRAMLIRAMEHLKNYRRYIDLKCELEEKDNYPNPTEDHIGKLKSAGKEYGWDSVDDEMMELNDCPLCSAVWAAYKARRIMKAKVGLINRILSRMGNNLRAKNDEINLS